MAVSSGDGLCDGAWAVTETFLHETAFRVPAYGDCVWKESVWDGARRELVGSRVAKRGRDRLRRAKDCAGNLRVRYPRTVAVNSVRRLRGEQQWSWEIGWCEAFVIMTTTHQAVLDEGAVRCVQTDFPQLWQAPRSPSCAVRKRGKVAAHGERTLLLQPRSRMVW